MHLRRQFLIPPIFLIVFAVGTIIDETTGKVEYTGNCEYGVSFSFMPEYRDLTKEGYFNDHRMLPTSNLVCTGVKLNHITPLTDYIDLRTWKGFAVGRSKQKVYLNILASNVPDLNIELLSYNLDIFTGIRIINSNVSRIDPTFMKEICNLEEIVLNNNNLDSNQTNNFFECKSLKVVSLSYNKLTSLGNLVNISNLEFLILNNNFITSLDGISNLQKLKQIDISHNNIFVIPNKFQNIHLIELDLSFNNITVYEDCRNVFESIKVNNNELKTLCRFANTIKEIDYSDNYVAHIDENSFKGLANLEELDLSNNEIEEITAGVFKDLLQLTHLNLSDNHIAALHLGCFANLRNIIKLDLKDNSLKHLDTGIFTDLSSLVYLDLSDNYIYNFDVTTILSLQNLNDLYLEEVYIDEETVEKFSEYFPYLKSVSLTFTSVGCDKLIGIIKKLKSNGINVKKGSAGYRENINGIYCDSSIKNATETVEEIRLYNVLKSMSRIYAILIVICIMIISIVLSTIIKKSYDMSKKYKNISNAQIL